MLPYFSIFSPLQLWGAHVVDAPNIRTFALPNDPITSCNEKPLLLQKREKYTNGAILSFVDVKSGSTYSYKSYYFSMYTKNYSVSQVPLYERKFVMTFLVPGSEEFFLTTDIYSNKIETCTNVEKCNNF